MYLPNVSKQWLLHEEELGSVSYWLTAVYPREEEWAIKSHTPKNHCSGQLTTRFLVALCVGRETATSGLITAPG